MAQAKQESSTPLTLGQRINEVRRNVKYLQKDVTVGGKYKAVTHDAVTALVRAQLVEQGVLILPSLESSELTETGTTTGKGIPIMRYAATYDVWVVNADDITDRLSMRMEAHAFDEGDKAPGKVISYCVKYAMLKMLNIETGEDEESRVPTQAEEVAPDPKGKKALEACTSISSLQAQWKALTEEQRETLYVVVEECKKNIKEADAKASEEQ